MENKKQILSMQLNVDDFAPASDSEKESLSVMRESVSFWKDGLRRLRKNPIAMVSLAVLIIVLILAFIVPAFYPYDYATQIRGSENLGPMQYSEAEQAAMAAGEKVFPHILGTDSLGRDYAVRVMMGTRVSLSVGLLASVLVLLIGSAVISSFLDNIPFVATMIPILLAMESTGMDVTPLWWAVSLGACLGGNGTLIGASANVVLSDISKKHGYEITFAKFFKTGFPIMLLTILIAGVYLVVRFPPA